MAQKALLSFIEKPDRATAENYLVQGRYFWNSGMFCFTAGKMAENLAMHAADVWGASEVAFGEAVEEENVIRFEEAVLSLNPIFLSTMR